MNILNIFKRKKLKQKMPEPDFSDNWKQGKFDKNIKEGVLSLQKGKEINIYMMMEGDMNWLVKLKNNLY